MESPQLSLLESSLKQHLMPIFANLSEEILDICVRDPSNLSNLQLCIDDLLELRTYTRHLAQSTSAPAADNWRRDPVVVDSDDDGDLVGALLSAESEEVQITQQFPATRRLDTDCVVTDVDSSRKKRCPLKIREATFICHSPSENLETSVSVASFQKFGLLGDVEFDNELPRFSSTSKVKTKSPVAHKLSSNNAIPFSKSKTSTSIPDTGHSILDTGHTAVVQQWRQNPVQSLFTSSSKGMKSDVGSEVNDKNCDPDTVCPTKNKSDDVCVVKKDEKSKSIVSGILSPAKLKLPASPLKQKLTASNSHKYRFNPDSFQSSSVPFIRPPVFKPGQDASEPLTGTSNSPHNTLSTVTTSSTSQDGTPKKIKFKKSLILPGDRLPATTVTNGDMSKVLMSDRLQASPSNVSRQDDKDSSHVSHLEYHEGSLAITNKKEKTGRVPASVCVSTSQNEYQSITSKITLPSTSTGQQSYVSNRLPAVALLTDQNNGLLAPASNLNTPQSLNVKELQTTTNGSQNVNYSNRPWVQTPPSPNQVASKVPPKTSNKWPWLHEPVTTSNQPLTSNKLHTTSGPQTSNNWLQTPSSTGLSSNKHKVVPQGPQNSTINMPLASTSIVVQSTESNRLIVVSNAPQNSTVCRPVANSTSNVTKSTDSNRLIVVSNAPQNSTVCRPVANSTSNVTKSTDSKRLFVASNAPQNSTVCRPVASTSTVTKSTDSNRVFVASNAPQNSTVCRPVASTSTVTKSTESNRLIVVSNAPQNSTVCRPVASTSNVTKSTDSKRLFVASNAPQNSTVCRPVASTSTVTKSDSSRMQQSVSPHQSMLSRQQSANSVSKAGASSTAKLSVTAKLPSSSNTSLGNPNDYIVASASGHWKATPGKRPSSSTTSADGVFTDKSQNTKLSDASLAGTQASKAVSAAQKTVSNKTVNHSDQAALPAGAGKSPVHHTAATPGVTNPKTDPLPVIASADMHTRTVTSGEKAQAPPSTEVPAPKSRTEHLIEDVLALFGDADPAYVRRMVEMELLTQRLDHEIVNNLCNLLLENQTYPRAQSSATVTSTEVKSTPEIDDIDYYQEYRKNEKRAVGYYGQSEKLLLHQFMWISAQLVRKVIRWYNGLYAPTHQVLSQVMKQRREDIKKDKGDVSYSLKLQSLHAGALINITIAPYGKERPLSVTLLKNWRRSSPPALVGVDPYLQNEINFIKRKQLDEFEEADHQMALMLNETEYEECGQLIECGCCYGEVPFENMIQCYEGHLFCDDCLQRYAKEAVFGAGKADLMCMTEGCDASYPVNQLSKALPSSILSKYEDRVQEENINLADLPDLVRCPHCDFAAMLDPRYPLFRCANPACEKETCRHCKEPWADHIGKTCDQVEKKDEVKLRVQFEEKMTMAKIRTCIKCKTKFTKSEGCNKMTCRCGSKMCYICRKPNIDYHHFCQHVRDPGKGCDKCTACFLWSTGEEDDKRAIEEIRKEAEEARKAQGYVDSKLIGAPDEPPKKKVKV